MIQSRYDNIVDYDAPSATRKTMQADLIIEYAH